MPRRSKIAKPAPAASAIYQLKIELKNTKPSIWRRVLVSSDATFADLHDVIQIVMEWENAHLYSFEIGKRPNRISIQSSYDPLGGRLDTFFATHDREAEKVRISEFLQAKRDKVIYQYDFGDSWDHIVTLEKILDKGETDRPVPACLAGERRCPPEDCGGVWGFYDLQKALEDKKHPNHSEMLEWLGGEIPDWKEFSAKTADKNLEWLRPGRKKRASNC